jgi:hypothetical protein
MLISKYCISSTALNLTSIRIFGCLLLALIAVSARHAHGATGLVQTSTISGVVTDQSGNHLSAATVLLSGTVTSTTTTDSVGNYAFSGLPAGGTYFLSISTGGPTSDILGVVRNLSSDQVVNLKLLTSISVVVHVKDENGNGVGGVSILLKFGEATSLSPIAQTNSSGDANFSFSFATFGVGPPPPVTLMLQKPFLSFTPSSVSLDTQLSSPQVFDFTAKASTTPTAYIQFSAASYVVGEGARPLRFRFQVAHLVIAAVPCSLDLKNRTSQWLRARSVSLQVKPEKRLMCPADACQGPHGLRF